MLSNISLSYILFVVEMTCGPWVVRQTPCEKWLELAPNLSVHLSVCVSVCLSVCPSVRLSVCYSEHSVRRKVLEGIRQSSARQPEVLNSHNTAKATTFTCMLHLMKDDTERQSAKLVEDDNVYTNSLLQQAHLGSGR